MASGQLLLKFRNIYNRVDRDIDQWNAIQSQSLSLLQTAVNIILRLPALSNSKNYGPNVSSLDSNIPQKLVGKQLIVLEDILADIQTQLQQLDVIVSSLRKAHRDAVSLIQQEGKRLSSNSSSSNSNNGGSSALSKSAGPIPSIDECLGFLSSVGEMYGEEVWLKRALVAKVHYEAKEDDLSEVVEVFGRQPCIDVQKVKDGIWVVNQAAESMV